MMILCDIFLILFAYLLGSIPFGYIFTKKATGKNITELGSGNIGSTNVKRIAGKRISALTQICDMLKGLIPVLLVLILLEYGFKPVIEYLIYFVAIAAIAGHNFSIFLKFKGGKGVNTTLGATVLIAPIPVFTSVAVYFIVKKISGYVSSGSVALAICLAATGFIIHNNLQVIIYLIVCCAFIIVRHTENIKRLLNRTENKAPE